MNPAIFVISLPQSTDRQQSIAAQLNRHKLDFAWHQAVDGRKLDEKTVGRLYSAELAEQALGRQLSRGEIGCALSHLEIYQMMISQSIETALVLEDDSALSADFGEQLRRVCAAADWNDADVILLNYIEKYTNWGAHKIGKDLRIVRPLKTFAANGYLISRSGAEKLLAELRPVHKPADCWNDLLKIRGLKIRGVVPYIVHVTELAEASLIGTELRLNPRSTMGRSAGRILKKIFYDKFIHQLLVKPILRIQKQRMTW